AVLTRLRAAAAAPGPLTVYVAGQLHLDRRQRLVHLALARTTPATVRYTAFPWHWFRDELRLRPAGTTTLVLDLHADAETRQILCAPPVPGRPAPLDCGPHSAVHGRIAPVPGRRTVAVPAYMTAVATILRSGRRPPEEELHRLAFARTAADGADPGLELAPVRRAAAAGGGRAPAGVRPDRGGRRGPGSGAGAGRAGGGGGRSDRGRLRRRPPRPARRRRRARRPPRTGRRPGPRARLRGGPALGGGTGRPGDAGRGRGPQLPHLAGRGAGAAGRRPAGGRARGRGGRGPRAPPVGPDRRRAPGA